MMRGPHFFQKTFWVLGAVFFLGLTGCLQTRSDVRSGEQRQVLQQQMGSIQRSNADVSNRLSDIEEQMRFLNGRLEVVENKLSTSKGDADQFRKSTLDATQDQNKKLPIYQDALTKMEQNLTSLQADVAALKAENLAAQARQDAAKAAAAAAANKNPYEAGEKHFQKKEYKSAILEYEKYRSQNSKGKYFKSATYKIALSFLGLGMKDEAKTFFDEVIAKYPKSEEARKAKKRLQKLK